MVKVFSGITGNWYFISPLLMVYRPKSCIPSKSVYVMRSSPPPSTFT